MRDQDLSFGTLPVTRRRVLRWSIIGGALVIVPTGTLIGCGDDDNSRPRPTPTVVPPTATPTPGFLTDEEERVLAAVSARIIPTDDLPGAAEAEAANYIEILLSELPDESAPGRVFAGGPFSGRTPFPIRPPASRPIVSRPTPSRSSSR